MATGRTVMNEKSSLRSGSGGSNGGGTNFTFRYTAQQQQQQQPASNSDDENVLYSVADEVANGRPAASVCEINAVFEDRSPVDKDYSINGTKLPTSLDNLMSRRHVENPISNLDAMMHLVKCNVGTGILAMPDAIKNAGLTLGSVGLVVISIVCIHCMHIVVKCSHQLCVRTDSTSLNYATTAQYAFATGPTSIRRFSAFSRFLTNFFLCVTQLGFCCVYFVFVSNNIKDIVDRNTSGGSRLDYRVYAAIVLLPIILMNLLRNLKFLAPASMIANILQVVSLCIVFSYICRDMPPVSSRQQVAHFSTLPLWFGTVIFAFEGIGLALPLENSMKTPQDFGGLTGVLNTSMVIVTCMYFAVGFYGYVKYGDDALGSITLNLPNGILADVVRAAYALAIFLTYAVQFYVPIQVMWPSISYRLSSKLQYAGEIVFRIAVILITFAMACLIPQLNLFISLIGSFSATYLTLILPPILDMVTFWNNGIRLPAILKDVTIVAIGVLGCFTGTYVSVVQITETFGRYN